MRDHTKILPHLRILEFALEEPSIYGLSAVTRCRSFDRKPMTSRNLPCIWWPNQRLRIIMANDVDAPLRLTKTGKPGPHTSHQAPHRAMPPGVKGLYAAFSWISSGYEAQVKSMVRGVQAFMPSSKAVDRRYHEEVTSVPLGTPLDRFTPSCSRSPQPLDMARSRGNK
jgi:hypothetical protein